ncbi:disease resistance protein At4g27190-like [Neltuma alba]|uniref:disease resistance protein At4g27190-like n=1 Tax=Neltuma alba TaxID=207710 RepID=UPI0010A4234E|nr:disease resistance protein At4g27190-like [Prosopis alba]
MDNTYCSRPETSYLRPVSRQIWSLQANSILLTLENLQPQTESATSSVTEVGVSVAAKLAEYLVHPTLQQLQYLFCVGKISKNVEIRKEELILKQGRVQERVQEAVNRTERIDDEVHRWKNDVKSLIAEVENLEERLRANHGCLRGLCPTWRRYYLCKKLAKTIRRMIDLITKSNRLDPFSHPVIVPDIVYHSSQNFKLFNSTQMAFDQLWEALQNEGSSVIGLWGMGGSGKTTLVTEVGKKAKESQLFDRVVIATISQSLDIMQIQDEIADSLGLKLEEKSKTGRAKRIALRLQGGKPILVILDDIWAKLNLEHIGIPMGGNLQRSCKVVLTTRLLEVCTLMECQKTIKLDLLKEDEAWILFQSHANVNDAAQQDMARQIAMECKGLPIAIVAVGTCLKEKGVDEMKVMLHQLRNAKATNVNKGVRDAFTCLELSYDNLATREAKLLLLMCAMFPEDHNISVEDLFRYGVGLGLCEDVDSFEIARCQVITTINDLINSSLLMCSSKFNTNAQEYVTMHDMVRDFALWKASKEDRTIGVSCGKELNEVIADEVVKNCYAVSSWYENNKHFEFPSQLDVFQFPSQLDAPKLEFLLLQSGKLLDISDASFEGTKGLKALIISSSYFGQPNARLLQHQSIQHLSNLRTLQLQGWNLRDISFVVSLTRLEILDLQRSMFERLPNGIENLNKLKLLDLSDCYIGECCCKVIGRCSQLEELYVTMHCPQSKIAKCYECLMAPTALIKLRRYRIGIGEHKLMSQKESARYLRLVQLNIAMLGVGIKDLAQRATTIKFHELEGGSRSFMPNVVQAIGAMNELTKLCLGRCSEMECIVDKINTHEDAISPRLDELVLKDMDNLQQLHRGLSSFSLFQKLETLRISNCPQLLHIFPADCNIGNLKFLNIFGCPRLTSLFPVSAVCTLLSLQELQIERCNELKHVIEGEGGGDALERLCISNCPQLLHIFPADCNIGNLKFLNIFGCPRLTSLFPVSAVCTLLSLQELQIERCNELKHVIEGEGGGDALERLYISNCPQLLHIFPADCNLGNLKFLNIFGCPKLTSLFPVSVVCTLLSLRELRIQSCSELKHVLEGESDGDAWENLSFPKLKILSVGDCCKLESVCSVFLAQRFVQLQRLSITNAPQMKFVFGENADEEQPLRDQDETQIALSLLEYLTLTSLPNLVGICSERYHLRGPSIKTIEWKDCPNLELESHQRNEEHKSLTTIESIQLHNCGVESISLYKTGVEEQYPTFQSLKELALRNHARLKFVFSAHMCQSLPELTSVTISCCEELEAIFSENEETQKNPPNAESCLPKLKTLRVSGCNKLKFILSFMIGPTVSMLPQLSTLAISNSSEMEEIFKCPNIEDHHIDSSEKEITFPNMKYLELKNLPRLVNVCQGFKLQTGEFYMVAVHDCPKLMPIMGASIHWTKEGLVRKYVLRYSQLDNNEALNNLPLSVLNIGELDIQSPRVEHERRVIVNDEQEEANNSEMLRSEEQMVGGLVPTQVLSFQHLHSLEVTHNKKLKFLFSRSTIVHTSLPKLTSLTLSDCEELEVIFRQSSEGDANYSETIVLSSLRTIELTNLSNLTSVCQGLQI